MRYKISEVFYTLQGEGTHTGRAAVFVRFLVCNLWNGREQDRARSICQFCDTDLLADGRYYSIDELADTVEGLWPARSYDRRMVVITGGEPLLQLTAGGVAALRKRGFYVAVETNGTRPVPEGIDWLCVSPKIGAPLTVTAGDELKLVYPQAGGDPEQFTGLDFTSFRLQPMDGPNLAENTAAAVTYCQAHPLWQLSLQTHKYLGIP